MSAQSQSSTSGTSDDPRFEIGDYVVDTEAADPDPARVINRPGIPAEDWDSHPDEDGEQLTVADCNPEYDPTEHVVVVLFCNQLSDHYPEWEGDTPLNLDEVTADDITHYAFPANRLKQIPRELPPNPPEGLVTVAEALESGATVEFVRGDEQWQLEIQKIGIDYMVTASGEIDGSGPHRDDIIELVGKHL